VDETRRSERKYRTDVQVFFFSMPIFQRSGVGTGRASWLDFQDSPNAPVQRWLEFTGYSYPDRAAGLNRFGLIQESSTVDPKGVAESKYFGLMTCSPEESVRSARKALSQSAHELDYRAIQGRISPGSVETTVASFKAPAEMAANGHTSLIEYARKALGSGARKTPDFDPRTTDAQPFLHALVEAVIRRAPSSTCVYAGRLYQFDLRSAADSQATAYFRQRNLIPSGNSILRIDGRIRAAGERKDSEFRIWIEENDPRPVPLRIEYRPKPYLRLTFETETA
jgi:hypothetical protein